MYLAIVRSLGDTAKQLSYVPSNLHFTAYSGLAYAFILYCAFIVLYLSCKYIPVLADGEKKTKLICYVLMFVIALFILSRVGSSSLIEFKWVAVFAMLVPGIFMLLGVGLSVRADRSTKLIWQILLYACSALALIVGVVGTVAMSTTLI